MAESLSLFGLIEAAGLKKKEAARLLGVSYISLWRWNRGDHPMPPDLAHALERTDVSIFRRRGVPGSQPPIAVVVLAGGMPKEDIEVVLRQALDRVESWWISGPP